jgi:predicted Zn-dependent protease
VIAFVLIAAAAAGAAVWGYGELVDRIVARIPARYEAELGAVAGGGLDKAAITDPAVVAAVDRVSARLIAAMPDSPYRFKIVVVPDKAVNAFALPGGRIAVNAGLIAEAESPDELAGVLAHEMTHVLRRHSLRGIVQQLGVRTLFALVFSGRGDAAEALNEFAPGLLGLRFSRGQEAEADRGGMELLFAAGIPGEGMVRFFQRLSTQESGTARAMNFASDHPTSRGRFEELERLRTSRPAPPPVAWDIDWALVRERCRAAAAAGKAPEGK